MQAEAEAQGDVLPPPTLASLPTVILEQVLTTSFPWFTLASDGRVVVPQMAAWSCAIEISGSLEVL